jgi:hypothetical protein
MHATVDPPRNRYTYTQPLAYTIQQLHLTPRAEPQQHVLSWKLATPGHLHAYTDAYGNLSHMLTLNAPHDALAHRGRGRGRDQRRWRTGRRMPPTTTCRR